jgi:hypothetical protein
MLRTLFALSVLTGSSVALSAQQAQTPREQTEPRAHPSQNPKTPTDAESPKIATAGRQTWSGVLMDASCKVISNEKSENSSGLKTYSGPTPRPGASTTPEGAEVPARPRTQAGATPGAPEDDPLAPRTARPGVGATPQAHPSATAQEGQRSRTTDVEPADSSSFTTVREKYKDCMVKPSSTKFAIHSAGKLIVIDEASNQVVKQALSGDQFQGDLTDASGKPQWMSVTLSGPMQGDRLKVTSVSK